MNNSFFEKNKITVPYIDEKIIIRERLFDKLNTALKGKILFLSAPAGYGKTTLIANWLQHIDIKYLWISLDEQDNEPIRLIQYLCRGIIELIPEIIDFSTINSQEPSLIFERLYLHLQNLDEKIIIILDDLHIIKNPVCRDYIEKLIKNKPAKVELILSTRCTLSKEFEYLLLKQRLELLSEETLAFSESETNNFFFKKEKSTNNKLQIQQIQSIYKRTEGWPLGIVALSLGQSIPQLTNKIPKQKSIVLIFNFIENEVFSEFSSEEQQFMLETSILNSFTVEAANKITNFKNSNEILDSIVDKCNFLFVLNSGEIGYRYHHMFKEFLEHKLQDQSLDLLNQLHKNAGNYYNSLCDISMAIYHYNICDKEQIIKLISNKTSEVLLALQPSTIIELIDSLGSKGAFNNLNVCICYSWALQYNVEPMKSSEFLAYLNGLYHIRKNQLSRKDQRKIQLELNAMSFPSSIVRKDFEKTLNCLKNMFFSPVKEPIAFKLNTVKQLYSNEYTLRDTAFGLYGRQDFFIKFLTDMKNTKYKLVFNTIKKIPSLSIVQAEVYYEINNINKSINFISKPIEESRKNYNMKDYLPAMLCLANIQKARGNIEETSKTLKKCRETLKENNDFLGLETLYSYEARIYILLNDLRNLKKWENSLNISAHDDLTYVTRHSIYKYLTLALNLAKTNRYVMARMLINKILKILDRVDDLVYKSQALYIDALIMLREGNQEDCIKRIEQLFYLGKENMYYRTYVDFGSELLELINIWEDSDNKTYEFENYVNQIKELSINFAKITKQNLSIKNTILSKRERDILFYICRNLTNQEIADELFISVQTVKNHTSNIYKKLGISSRIQAINIANERLNF